MSNITKNILREPLLHFLLLGALAYIYFTYQDQDTATQQKTSLTLQSYEIDALQDQLGASNESISRGYLKYKKILLQEAYSLELYKENPTIDLLLLEKMEYLFKNEQQFQEPSELELQKYYEENLFDYSKVSSYTLLSQSFDQSTDQKMIHTLTFICDLDKNATKYKSLTPQKLQESFGRYIALKLSELPSNMWSEVFRLNGRYYIFKIIKKDIVGPYPFEEVEGTVYENYKKQKRLQYQTQEYKKLLDKYTFQEQ